MKITISSLFFIFCTSISISLHAQPYTVWPDQEKNFLQAKTYCSYGQFQFAYPLLKDLKTYFRGTHIQHPNFTVEEIDYYYILCELKLLHSTAESDAEDFIQDHHVKWLNTMMCYQLAHYFYQQKKYDQALGYYKLITYDNLSNEQLADARFEMAYSFFLLKKFSEAKLLFKEIAQIKSSKHFYAANYYDGFISYYQKEYQSALASFRLVEQHSEYHQVVPYYIAEILYEIGKSKEALAYGDSIIALTTPFYYLNELTLFMAHLNFESKQYASALKYYEAYLTRKNNISKEAQYELSYCYLQTHQSLKAIDGFKKLSNERDSLGQNSMYQLGLLYLGIGDKPGARNAFQYGAYNNSNKNQQEISRFNYAKLSFELGYQDIALKEIKSYLQDYPTSSNYAEAKELMVNLLASTNNFQEGIALYDSLVNPSDRLKQLYPSLLFGRAIEWINEQQLSKALDLLNKITNLKESVSVLPYAKFWIGEIACRQKRYDEAIENFNQFLQLDFVAQGEMTTENAMYSLAYSYFQQEDYRNALKKFESLSRTNKKLSENIQNDMAVRMADCYYMLKDYTKALNAYNEVISKKCNQSDYALYQKAMIAGVKSGEDKVKLLKQLKDQFPSSSMLIDAEMEIATTYIADLKFADAIPYLKNVLGNKYAIRLKPIAYHKLGLCYFNSNNNPEALKNYRKLIEEYPLSEEAHEALDIIKDIFIEEGKPDEYFDFLKKNHIAFQVNEQDSIRYITAYNKFTSSDFVNAVEAFEKYLTEFPSGQYILEANYFYGMAQINMKQLLKAKKGLDVVCQKGLSPYYEDALLELAKIYYFELKKYDSAKKYFEILVNTASDPENQIEGLRGLVRSYYQLKNYRTANLNAAELLKRKGISADDKAISFLVLGKSQQELENFENAIEAYNQLIKINNTAWGAEARYEKARCYLSLNNLSASEASALSVIKETGSFDEWVTKSYVLLGDIFLKQKDYFNAKATYESVYKNTVIPELKREAKQKLDATILEEKKQKK